MKQIITMIQADDYGSLVRRINNDIDPLDQMYIKQIDYFGMKENEPSICTAIILWSMKNE